MYSAKIDGKPTTFGTSGLLYRSNKLMYDRATNTIWHQFTGEPVIGPLAGGTRLPFFPSTLTTWQEWLDEHPDTTVLSDETGVYPASRYQPEAEPRSIYFEYRRDPGTMFPVWPRNDQLDTKDIVLGLEIGGETKAYPIKVLQRDRVVNDTVGGADVVVVASANSQAARAYERDGRTFSLADAGGGLAAESVGASLVDSDGVTWRVTEEFLVSEADASQQLERIPTRTTLWFGWFAFHPDTQVHTSDRG